MIVAGWADGYTNIALPRLRGADLPEARDPRPLGPRLDRDGASRAAHRPRAGADPLVPPLARRRGERRRRRSRRSPSSRAARRGPAPDLAEMRGEWRSEPTWPPERLVEHVLRPDGDGHRHDPRARRRRAAAWISCAGRRPWGLPGRPALRRRALAHLRLGAARRRPRRDGPPARAADGHVARPGRLPLGAALRRLPGRRPRRSRAVAILNLTHRDGHDAPSRARAGRADARSSSSSRRPRGCSSRATGCASRSRAPTGRTPGRRRRGAPLQVERGERRARAARARRATGRCRPRACRRRRARTRTHPARTASSLRSCGGSRTTSSGTRPAR